jgi:hypothetical protein
MHVYHIIIINLIINKYKIDYLFGLFNNQLTINTLIY